MASNTGRIAPPKRCQIFQLYAAHSGAVGPTRISEDMLDTVPYEHLVKDLATAQPHKRLIHLLPRHMLQWLHIIPGFLLKSGAWNGSLLPFNSQLSSLENL